MKCDLCGRHIDPGHSRSYREVPDSQVCEECFKAVTATGGEEKGTVTSVRRTPRSDSSPEAAGVRCERCGRPWINSGPCPACHGERDKVTTPLPGPARTPPEPNAVVTLFTILGKIVLGLIAAVILLFVVMFIVCLAK